MKIIYRLFLLMIFFTQFSFGQETPESIAESFFNYVQEGMYSKAVDYLVSSNPNLKNDSTIITRLAKNLEVAYTRNGAYCGYELIEKDQVSASYSSYVYFIKYLNNPVRIQIDFYKPREKWQVNNVQLIRQAREQEGRNTQGNNVNRQKSAKKIQ
jgi:hypothetical protein